MRFAVHALTLWFLVLASAATAQTPALAPLSAQLSQAEEDLRAASRTFDDRISDQDRQLLRSKTAAARDSAADAARQLEAQLALLDARISQLGPVSGDVAETADIRRERTRLAQQRSAIDSAIKRGRLLDLEAQQLTDEIARNQAEQLNERLSTRAPSPLSPAFWSAILSNLPRDAQRISAFVQSGRKAFSAGWARGVPWPALIGLAIGLAILIPGRTAARRLGYRFLVQDAPGWRARRSLNALWRVITGTIAPLLAALVLVQGLRWSFALPDRWSGMLAALVFAAGFGGFTGSIASALLMRSHPAWRPTAVSDDAARKLWHFGWLLALLAGFSLLLDAFNLAVRASAAARTGAQAIEAILHITLIGGLLLTVGRLRAARSEAETGSPAGTWLGAVTLAAWLVIGLAGVALVGGYIAISLFLVRVLAWAAIVGGAAWLLMTTVDDVIATSLYRGSRIGRTATSALGLKGGAIDQFGVLLSGALRLTVALLALSLLLSPFGAGGSIGTLFGRLGGLAQGFEIGGVAVSPGTILRGLIVLFIGLALLRMFMRWLEGRYLPATDLDISGRNSVSLVARYVGIALAVIWALASLGIGVERIALLLSALSVGIGFGLQAITQNFVSGLILLAERPIKIGDLIRVGTDEGDVKRISVRSTEITLADHSTLIVPNSELITKSVLNKTLASPLGRIQIMFSVPIEADAGRVKEIVLDAFAAEGAVLKEPAPAVFVDSIADGRIAFNCFAHVASPRAVYGARSNVFMTILERLRAEHIPIGTVPQKLELVRPDRPDVE